MSPFLIYPQNQEYLDGKRRMPVNVPHAPGCIVLFAAIFPLAGILIIVTAITLLRENILLSLEPVDAAAIIINRYIEDDDDDTDYTIVYQYSVDGQRYTDEQDVSEEAYNGYTIEQRIGIYYARSDPSLSRIIGTNSWGLAIFMLVFCVVWMFVSIIFLGAMVQSNRVYRRMRRSAQRVYGSLLALKEDTDSDGGLEWQVTVQFRAPDTQRSIEGQRTYSVSGEKRPPPPTGTTLWVFYLDEAHWHVL